MTTPQPGLEGWYPDPVDDGVLRWWTGHAWTAAQKPGDVAEVGGGKRSGGGVWRLVAIVVVVVAVAAGLGSQGPDAEMVAYVACQERVEGLLRAPATAEWPLSSSQAVTGDGADRYRVVAVVDSENGFGAMVRSDVECVVEVTGDDYHLVDARVG